MKQTLTLVLAAIALVFGLAVGWRLWAPQTSPPIGESTGSIQMGIVEPTRPSAAPTAVPPHKDLQAEIADLNRLLRDEIAARQAITQRLNKVEQQLTSLIPNLDSDVTVAASDTSAPRSANENDGDPSWFDEQSMVSSGIGSSLAAELKAFYEQLEMERLKLHDQSVREDWSEETLRDAMRTLEDRETDLKERLSERAYDAYLYASGRSNRVRITRVLETSQAGLAGILPGDHVIRYDNERLYRGFDLRQATTAGRLGEMVELEIERDGDRRSFYVDRGPLGVRIESVRIAP